MSMPSLFPELDPGFDAPPRPPASLNDIVRLARSYRVRVLPGLNEFGPSRTRPDPGATWEAALAEGQSYLCGSSVSREAFLRVYRRPLLDWMVPAHAWARQNLDRVLTLYSRPCSWHVYQRGEYVSFTLPFHDSGGEKEYISRDGVSRIKVNDD
jgi:hypothetical protein